MEILPDNYWYPAPPKPSGEGKKQRNLLGYHGKLMEPNSLPTQIKICQFGFSLEICVDHSGWTFMVNENACVQYTAIVVVRLHKAIFIKYTILQLHNVFAAIDLKS